MIPAKLIHMMSAEYVMMIHQMFASRTVPVYGEVMHILIQFMQIPMEMVLVMLMVRHRIYALLQGY